jgi:hypothetical protein
VRILKGGNTRDQPFRSERRRRADRQQLIAIGPLQSGRGATQILKGRSDRGQVALRLAGQQQGTVAPHE